MRPTNDVCERCGIKYVELRTGLTYYDVYRMLWSYSDDPREWRYKGRSAVLGKWHQIKLEYWEYHLEGCNGAGYEAEEEAELEEEETVAPF